MSLKCVAIDDEPLALELIHSYVSRLPEVHLVQAFEDAVSGAEFLSVATIDLVFLDINMPDISGLDLAKSLSKKTMVIFTTAHKQFAFDGFELEAIDYLLKPIDFERFSKAVHKAIEVKDYRKGTRSSDESFIYVNSEYRIIKIMNKEIEYIESLEDYVKFHLDGDRQVLTLSTLKKISSMLPQKQFLRIHRSYVIPIHKIQSIQNKKIQLKNILLPIGDRYSEEVKTALNT
jgi:two-component system LytT family response regulator